MISESVLENSVFLLWLKQLPAQYDNLNRRINMFYLDSWSYKINTGFRNAVALAFKYSFIGKASQVDNLADKIDFGVFGGSILLKSLFYFYSVYKIKISGYFNSSLVISSIK